jgi:hypothetical protein
MHAPQPALAAPPAQMFSRVCFGRPGLVMSMRCIGQGCYYGGIGPSSSRPQPTSACPFPLSRLLQGIGCSAKIQERHYRHCGSQDQAPLPCCKPSHLLSPAELGYIRAWVDDDPGCNWRVAIYSNDGVDEEVHRLLQAAGSRQPH